MNLVGYHEGKVVVLWAEKALVPLLLPQQFSFAGVFHRFQADLQKRIYERITMTSAGCRRRHRRCDDRYCADGLH